MTEAMTKIKEIIGSLLASLLRYKTFIYIMLILGIYVFLIFRINTLNGREPSQDDVISKLETVPRPKIDQSIADKISDLQDNSSQIKSLFNDARNNPFQE